MANILGSKGKASPAEEQKLIEEIQHLIEVKGLNAKLTVTGERAQVLTGCTGCTICPCMICW